MQHQDIHELLALDLYDELEGADRARLDAHLADCEDCRAFALELEHGLGRIVGASIEPDRPSDLPADWRVRLQREVEIAQPRGWLTRGFALGAAAGLAAGIALAWGILAGPARTSLPRPATYVASNAEVEDSPAFDGASKASPPKAQAGGELARFQRYLRK